MQTFEIGLSTSFRNVYGRYNATGEPEESSKTNSYTLALGAGARLTDELETFMIVPVVYQTNIFATNSVSRSSLGDVLLGGRFTLLKSLFRDDWYPTVTVSLGTSLPSGQVETFSNGKLSPGTGSGMWEPFIGLGLKKEYGSVTLSFDSTYTFKVRKKASNFAEDGDKIELSEAAIFPFSSRFSLGVGSRQTWTFDAVQNKVKVKDSSGRAIAALFSANYFLTRVWSVVGAVEFALPFSGLGVNQQLSRVVSLTTRYGFF